MANHRAERRAPSRRSLATRTGTRAIDLKIVAAEVQPTPRTTTDRGANLAVAEIAVTPVSAPVASVPAPVASVTVPGSSPGKRRAVKPTRAERTASREAERLAAKAAANREAQAARAAREAVKAAAHEQARAVRTEKVRARVQATHGGHTGGRKRPIPGLPSAPSLIGAAALAIAAVGATVSQQTTPVAGDDYQKFATQASVLNAASSIGASDALSGRQRAVSRDSEREALQDAADEELQKAAETQAKERSAALAALAASAEKHADQLAKNLWQFALPSGTYRVSHSYGQCSYLRANCHTGEDFGAPSGTPISSIATGTVTEAGYDGSYGNKTVVTLEDGTEIWYCHQTTIDVSVGQKVAAGEHIGTVGSTGNSTGPHLHLEVHPGAGDAVDPLAALAVHGVNP